MSSVLFAPPRTVRKVKSGDLEAMKKALNQGPPDKHAARYARQERGECVYLLAAQEETPVGHLLLKWDGAGHGPAAALEGVADVEDLFVDPAHRRRHVATRLLDEAERLAAARGYKRIGLSCGVDNEEARALYEKRGYRDADLGTFRLSGAWVDPESGEEGSWEEHCVYLVRDLGGAATADAPGVSETSEQSDAGGNSAMTDNGTEAGKVDAAQQSAPEETTSASAAASGEQQEEQVEKPLTDQVVDFAFGVALSAAETLEKVVNQAVGAAKDAPSFFEQMQEKGRPAREKLIRDLRGDVLKPARDAAETVADVATAGRASFKSAEDEIRALEERVKTLEREVVARTTVGAPDAGPFVADEDAPPAVEVETEGAVTEAPSDAAAASDAIPTPEDESTASAMDVETGEIALPDKQPKGAPKSSGKPATPKSRPAARKAGEEPESKPEGGDSGEA